MTVGGLHFLASINQRHPQAGVDMSCIQNGSWENNSPRIIQNIVDECVTHYCHYRPIIYNEFQTKNYITTTEVNFNSNAFNGWALYGTPGRFVIGSLETEMGVGEIRRTRGVRCTTLQVVYNTAVPRSSRPAQAVLNAMNTDRTGTSLSENNET